MAQVSIAQLRHLIRTLSYVVSTHAIVERQRDRATRETKYVIRGATLEGVAGEVLAKVGQSGKLLIITIYLC
jgi:hypothetical protein